MIWKIQEFNNLFTAERKLILGASVVQGCVYKVCGLHLFVWVSLILKSSWIKAILLYFQSFKTIVSSQMTR